MPSLNPATLGKFCREIAIGLSPLPVLLAEWGLTTVEYERIRQTEGYQHEMQVIVEEMRELGADAGYVYRMKSLSEEFLSDIVNIMRAPTTTPATKVDLIKFCAELGRLREKPVPVGKDVAPVRTGPHVVFHFGAGLPVKSIEVQEAPVTIDVPQSPRAVGFDISPE